MVLGVEAGRGGGGVGEPVDGHVGEDVVVAEGVAEELAAPGELAGGGVGQGVGDGLGLGGLELVVDRPLGKALEEGQVAELVVGEALQVGGVAGGEGEELVDMDPEDMVGVDPALEVRGSARSRYSRKVLGQPWVRISARASGSGERTWAKWMVWPSMVVVVNCGWWLSLASQAASRSGGASG